MKASDSPAQITHSTLQRHLGLYDTFIPSKIAGLEELRLNIILETLAQCVKDNDAFLEKTEVISLVEWKLKHGTYRPNLAKLVVSNSVAEIRTTTKSAFSTYSADPTDYAKSITALSKLKGISPATASLLLSCYDPVKVLFFNDELFDGCTRKKPNQKAGTGRLTIQSKNTKIFSQDYIHYKTD